MGQIDTPQARLNAEIQRIIANSVRSGSIVRTGYYAEMLAEAYPDADLTIDEIVGAIARAASKRGVPVEIRRPGTSLPEVIRL